MTDINVGAITEALNDKSDRDLQNVDNTAGADAVIETVSGSTEIYSFYGKKYKSGLVEIYYNLPTKSSYGEQTITLPWTMADTNYVALSSVGNYTGTNGITYSVIGVYTKTTTTFKTKNDNNFIKYVHIIGMAAV